MTLTGTAAINATGNGLVNVLQGNTADNVLSGLGGNDTLNGNDGNDTLDGGTGNDTLTGGLGNDIYIIDSISDVIVENASEGYDSVKSSITFTLAASLEKLTLTGAGAINGTGNASAIEW